MRFLGSRQLSIHLFLLATLLALPVRPSLAVTFTVDSHVDAVDANPGDGICASASDGCTLRAAIQEANALPGADKVIVTNGDFVLQGASPDDDAAATGDLDVLDDLVVEGQGYPGVPRIFSTDDPSSPLRTRIFDVFPPAHVELETIELIGSSSPSGAPGGGIRNAGDLTLTGCTVHGTTTSEGGAIANTGTLKIDGGGFAGGAPTGGCIYSSGSLDVFASDFDDCNANHGAGIYADGPTRIGSSIIWFNEAQQDCGGVVCRPDTVIINTRIEENAALGGSGGGLCGDCQLYNVTVRGNVTFAAGGIGGINGHPTMTNTLVVGNEYGLTRPRGVSDCTAVTSLGYDAISDPSCVVTGDLTGLIQGPAAATPGAPIDAGDPTGCHDDHGTLLVDDFRAFLHRRPSPPGGRCDIGAVEVQCGDGIVDPGQACDDGNNVDGDCCSADCHAEPAGQACDDGDACTTADACNQGVCVPGAPVSCGACEVCDATNGDCVGNVLTGCHEPAERFSGKLQIAASSTPKLKWQWTKGEATTTSEFGDPLGGDEYTLCLFDESSSPARAAFQARTRAGDCNGRPCWKAAGATSFSYKDGAQTPDGLDSAFFKSGRDGKAKVLMAGRGANLTPPTLPLPLPARMQLQGENGQCWEARYFELGTSRNDVSEFKAEAFQP